MEMTAVQPYSGPERRARDRSEGIQLRRRQKRTIDQALERRRMRENGFDIAAALEMHLDSVTTRRGMISLLESWLNEARQGDAEQRDEDYVRAVERAVDVMRNAPDPLTAIAILQRAPR